VFTADRIDSGRDSNVNTGTQTIINVQLPPDPLGSARSSVGTQAGRAAPGDAERREPSGRGVTTETVVTRRVIGVGVSKPAHYVERSQEMKALKKLMQQGSAAVSALQGMGGVGKSTLARAYAEAAVADYPDGVLWANFGRALRAESQIEGFLADWIGALGLGMPAASPA